MSIETELEQLVDKVSCKLGLVPNLAPIRDLKEIVTLLEKATQRKRDLRFRLFLDLDFDTIYQNVVKYTLIAVLAAKTRRKEVALLRVEVNTQKEYEVKIIACSSDPYSHFYLNKDEFQKGLVYLL
jgi:hypothetical protein